MQPLFESDGITVFPCLHRSATFIEHALRNVQHSLLRGTMERFVPIVMTALVTGEAGREIEDPRAVGILGGFVTSAALNLIVLPVLALRFGRYGVGRSMAAAAQ